MIDIHSLAGKFYLDYIDQQVDTLEEAFHKLYQWSRQNSNTHVYLQEWRTLNIADHKQDGVSWLQAMERLYERASKLQDLLDDAHRSPQLLLEALETAVEQQHFFIYVDRLGAQKCPHAYYQNCRIAIQKYTQHSKAYNPLRPAQTLAASVTSSISSTKQSQSEDDQCDDFTRAMILKATRRYGADNTKPTYRRTNPLGPDGQPKTCRHCGSIYHYLRYCDKLKKPALVNLMLEGNSPSSEHLHNLTVNSMLDRAQNFPDATWACFSSFDISTDTIFDEPSEKTDLGSVMYTRLSQISDFHEFIPKFDFRQAKLQPPPIEACPRILTKSSSPYPNSLLLNVRVKYRTESPS